MLGVRPLSTHPLSTLLAKFRSQTAVVTVRYATHSFVTRASDAPANTHIQGRINRGLTLARRLRPGPEGQFGSIIETSFGDIELNNADGALDVLSSDFFADGRAIRLKIGAKERVAATRITPQFVADGAQDVTGNAATNVQPAYPTEGVVPGDFFLAVITVNDRGEGGGLTGSPPAPWQLLREASNGAAYQAVLYHFAVGTEAGQAASFDWESVDGSNDVVVGRIRQFRYVDTTAPIDGLTAAAAGNITLLSMPTVVTVEPRSLAVAVASMSDNVSAVALTGETGGDWTPSLSLASASTADGVSDRIATAPIATGTISGGTWALTPSGTEVSEDSLITGFALRGLPVEGGYERVQPLSAFATVYQTVAGPWSHDHDVLRLRIQDLGAKLQDRMQLLTYSGAGGKNGTSDLAGRSRPLGYGAPPNITLQLVDPATFMFQANSGPVFAFDAVYDRGVALSFDQDYATYELLDAATVASGAFATCLAEGYCKVGGGADPGAITADVRFDESATHASTIRRILLEQSPLTLAELDDASFTAFATAQPGEIGVFFESGDESTVEQAIEAIAFSGGAMAGQDASGLYRVQRIEAPATTPHWAFDERTIVFDPGARMARREPPYEVPWKSWGIGYAKNWTVQRSNEVAAGVTAARKIYLASEYRFVFAQNSAVALSHQTSRSVIPRTFFLSLSDAQAESSRRSALYGPGRAVYEVPVKTALFSVRLGQTVRLTYSRWGLNQGQNFFVLGVNDDADSAISTLVVFG